MKKVLVVCVLVLGGLTLQADAQDGVASHYNVTKRIACPGQSISGLVAAHKTLPCGSHVRVTNKRNGRSIHVRIVDRGPFKKGRIIDLSVQAASALGFSGLTNVSVN